jgi:hypothetical protein
MTLSRMIPRRMTFNRIIICRMPFLTMAFGIVTFRRMPSSNIHTCIKCTIKITPIQKCTVKRFCVGATFEMRTTLCEICLLNDLRWLCIAWLNTEPKVVGREQDSGERERVRASLKKSDGVGNKFDR